MFKYIKYYINTIINDDLRKTIGDLIFFYIKTNYKKYLKDNNLTKIDDDKIEKVIEVYMMNDFTS